MDAKEAKEIVKVLGVLSYNQWISIRKIMDLKFQQRLDSVMIELKSGEDDLFIENIIAVTRDI